MEIGRKVERGEHGERRRHHCLVELRLLHNTPRMEGGGERALAAMESALSLSAATVLMIVIYYSL